MKTSSNCTCHRPVPSHPPPSDPLQAGGRLFATGAVKKGVSPCQGVDGEPLGRLEVDGDERDADPALVAAHEDAFVLLVGEVPVARDPVPRQVPYRCEEN